jgi:hypothetical protein
MGKKESASRLIKALGKTKKEQMAKLYPKVKGQIRGKGPYVRGTIGKKGASDFVKRRAAVAGTKFPAPTKAKKGIGISDVVAAGAAGLAIGSGQHKKLAKAVSGHFKKGKERSHQDIAREGAKELIKKQKSKKKKSLKEIFKNKDTMREAFGPRIRKKNPHGYRGG